MSHHNKPRFSGIDPVMSILIFVMFVSNVALADFPLPDEIRDKVEVIATFDSKQVVTSTDMAVYAEQQHLYTNLLGNAYKPEGKGGVFEGKILKTKKSFPLYRVYTKKADPRTGRNNRFGGWWTPVPPGKGSTKSDYRRRYEICESFNPDLDRVAQCWVYPGAVLLIGPGQSVDERTCGKPGESYAADAGKGNLQIFIFEMFNHSFPAHSELAPLLDIDHFIGCPSEGDDRPFDGYAVGRAM